MKIKRHLVRDIPRPIAKKLRLNLQKFNRAVEGYGRSCNSRETRFKIYKAQEFNCDIAEVKSTLIDLMSQVPLGCRVYVNDGSDGVITGKTGLRVILDESRVVPITDLCI